MTPREQVAELLNRDGAVLARKNKHEVWKLSNGKSFTRACTPGTFSSDLNNLSDLRKALDINGVRGLPGERRERKQKSDSRPQRPMAIGATVNGSLQECLLGSGLAYSGKQAEVDSLNEKIASMAALLEQAQNSNHRKRVALREMEEEKARCPWCQMRLGIRRLRFKLGCYFSKSETAK